MTRYYGYAIYVSTPDTPPVEVPVHEICFCIQESPELVWAAMRSSLSVWESANEAGVYVAKIRRANVPVCAVHQDGYEDWPQGTDLTTVYEFVYPEPEAK